MLFTFFLLFVVVFLNNFVYENVFRRIFSHSKVFFLILDCRIKIVDRLNNNSIYVKWVRYIGKNSFGQLINNLKSYRYFILHEGTHQILRKCRKNFNYETENRGGGVPVLNYKTLDFLI